MRVIWSLASTPSLASGKTTTTALHSSGYIPRVFLLRSTESTHKVQYLPRMLHHSLLSLLVIVLFLSSRGDCVNAQTSVCTRQNVSRTEDRIPYGTTSFDCVGSSQKFPVEIAKRSYSPVLSTEVPIWLANFVPKFNRIQRSAERYRWLLDSTGSIYNASLPSCAQIHRGCLGCCCNTLPLPLQICGTRRGSHVLGGSSEHSRLGYH